MFIQGLPDISEQGPERAAALQYSFLRKQRQETPGQCLPLWP